MKKNKDDTFKNILESMHKKYIGKLKSLRDNKNTNNTIIICCCKVKGGMASVTVIPRYLSFTDKELSFHK